METDVFWTFIVFIVYGVIVALGILLIDGIAEDEDRNADQALKDHADEHRKKSEDHSGYYNGMWP